MTSTLHSDEDHEVTGTVPLLPTTEPNVLVVTAAALAVPSVGTPTLPPPLIGAEPAVVEPHPNLETSDIDEPTDLSALDLEQPLPNSEESQTPARRWSQIVGVGLAVAALIATATWGWSQHSSANDWKARAVDLEDELVSTQDDLKSTKTELSETLGLLSETQDELSETESKLAEIEELLSVAEGQIEELDAQVATLANTKAQVEDERAQLSTVLASAPPVTTALRACVTSTLEVSEELLKVIGAYPYRSMTAASAMVDDTVAICSDAIAKSNDFQATLDALGV